MKLKTYTAPTMAQALAQVRKDLGSDAMILHTRSYRTGSWLGLGGKPMVEITASSPQPTIARKSRRVKHSTKPEPAKQTPPQREVATESMPEIVVQRSRVAQPQIVQSSQAETNEQMDDRAMLLQGLMGAAHSSTRDRRTEPEQRQAASESSITPKSEPTQDEFMPTTFEHVDTSLSSQPAPQIEEHQPDLEAEPKAIEFEPEETVIQIETDSVFETAIPAVRSSEGAREIEEVEDSIASESEQIELPQEPKPQTPETAALQAQIESLQKMMGQVLDTTRRTAVAVNKADGTLPPLEMSEPLHKHYTQMIDNDVSVELADRFVGAVRDRLDSYELRDDSVVRHALLREIELSIKTTSQSLLTQKPVSPTARPNVIALIGPTGVGKTTTVAKLAASAKLRHGKRVALITSDTYRIAAVEQLKTYASIIGLEIKIANSPDEMRSVISGLSDVDLIVIDTAGRSQNNHARLDELGQLIAAAEPDETHLVLSSTVGENVLRKTAERFIDLGPDRCILTKIDEAVTTGMIAGMSERIGGLPLSFVTVGQEVPDDILPAKPERLARAVLDGPSAVVPQN
jgi:flagellar biosynthesis protein FlhF